MTTLTRWAIAGAVCVLWAWSAVDHGPSDHEAAEAVEADRIEAIAAAAAKDE
jgi:hypothetical protein